MTRPAETALLGDVSRTHVVLMAVAGAVLVWLIVTRSLAAGLATAYPAAALVLQPAEPQALLALAKAEFDPVLAAAPVPARPDNSEGKGQEPSDRIAGLARLAELALLATPGDGQVASGSGAPAASKTADQTKSALTAEQAQRIGGLAKRVLDADPLNADAIGILAQLAELGGDPKTGTLMQAAARLAIRESYAHYWLMQEARRRGDDDTVLRQADTLLRTRPRTLPLVVPELGRIAESSGGAQKVGALLASGPPWRQAALMRLTETITDARTPLYLLLGLQGTAHPPKDDEVARYIQFLIGRKFHELAYYTWLQFLPPERLAGLTALNNRGFEWPLTGASFVWTLRQGSGATAEIRPVPDQPEGLALFVEFTQGRADFPGVEQTVLLGPGTYTLRGRHKGTLVGQRGLVWRVTCVGGGQAGQSENLRGDVQHWRTFEAEVTVPAQGCRAQRVKLELDARSASERFVTGSMWFDDLELVRRTP